MSDAEIIKEFLVESYENLDLLDRHLIALEKDPGNQETLASVFRTIHTIKGTSGFLSFYKLESVTHAGENLLACLRDGLLVLTPEITSALLTMVDAVRQMLGKIDSTGNEGERDDQSLIDHLMSLVPPESEPKPSKNPTLGTGETASQTTPQAILNVGDILVQAGKVTASDVREAVARQEAGDPRRVGEILVETGAVKPQDVLDALNIQQRARGSASESTLRVEVLQLDRLMNRVGELVLLRNQILQFTNSIDDPAFQGTSQRLNQLTTELQESVMKTRMQPIANIWSRFPRTVRDVAHSCGKLVHIAMEGEGTELDKTIIEAIKDPLTHLVRNAVDHGIELPEMRRAVGKNPEGRIFLRAFHESGHVNIEISDDGAGLDLEKVRRRAVQTRLITSGQAEQMSEHDLTQLIFHPGLSTADKVTNVSGRGVGMDVVKINIEKIGGVVDVQSKRGQGSTVRLKIPLTLAIIPALIVTAAGDRYAVPQVNLRELVRLEGDRERHGIERLNGARFYRLRGRLLPLIDLSVALHGKAISPSDFLGAQTANIVVLQADDRQFGLVVDAINDTEEIVVKPVAKELKSVGTFAGATIMGDGRVALILDVLSLAQRAHIVGEKRDAAAAETEKAQSSETEGRFNAVLLFQCGEAGRMAIDLAAVARLEVFDCSSVETAGSLQLVQYRGQIMPLIRVSEVLENRSAIQTESPTLHVLVHTEKGRSVGLVVDRILDIVKESFEMQPQTRRSGVLGSAVIQKRVTEILDVPGLIAAAGDRLFAGVQIS